MKYVIVPTYWILIAILLTVIVWRGLPYESIEKLEQFIRCRYGIIISLGTVALLSLLAYASAAISSTSAENAQKANRSLSSELKLSDFRQAWIDVLRADCAEVLSLTYSFSDDTKDQKQKIARLKRLDAQIRMRLNPKEDAHLERSLEDAIVSLISALEIVSKQDSNQFKDTDLKDVVTERREVFAKLSAKLLKEEWDVLKDNLEKLKAGK